MEKFGLIIVTTREKGPIHFSLYANGEIDNVGSKLRPANSLSEGCGEESKRKGGRKRKGTFLISTEEISPEKRVAAVKGWKSGQLRFPRHFIVLLYRR